MNFSISFIKIYTRFIIKAQLKLSIINDSKSYFHTMPDGFPQPLHTIISLSIKKLSCKRCTVGGPVSNNHRNHYHYKNGLWRSGRIKISNNDEKRGKVNSFGKVMNINAVITERNSTPTLDRQTHQLQHKNEMHLEKNWNLN